MLCFAAACAPGGRPHTVAARPGPCRPADSLAVDLVDELRQYAEPTDEGWAETADSLRLPHPAAVTLVRDPDVCSRAAAAYAAESRARPRGLSGRGVVARVGAVYVVWDPDYSWDRALAAPARIVFDRRWRVLSRF